ncbi:hypothetical protein GCM10010123_21100 [Pilimelia anulata]|uniref:Uncharacterized protein n=1 Tax=Pilimelia anulata TaxID=53371 RepID=A0A8J3B7F3_9ACTN|nr:hypothetical protein [Pilimelia anulata]GGJ91001.1 hypothetical protein GCM10010123_21100 [Pilimelia anulata]
MTTAEYHHTGDNISMHGDGNIGKVVGSIDPGPAVARARELIDLLHREGHLTADGTPTGPGTVEAILRQRERMPELFDAVRRRGGGFLLDALSGTAAAVVVALIGQIVNA